MKKNHVFFGMIFEMVGYLLKSFLSSFTIQLITGFFFICPCMLVEAFHQLAGLASDLEDLNLNSNLMCGHIFGVLLDCPPQGIHTTHWTYTASSGFLMALGILPSLQP
jgi:hypothetical protein